MLEAGTIDFYVSLFPVLPKGLHDMNGNSDEKLRRFSFGHKMRFSGAYVPRDFWRYVSGENCRMVMGSFVDCIAPSRHGRFAGNTFVFICIMKPNSTIRDGSENA